MKKKMNIKSECHSRSASDVRNLDPLSRAFGTQGMTKRERMTGCESGVFTSSSHSEPFMGEESIKDGSFGRFTPSRMTQCGECGRSMVEMLGTLAIVGILSVLGVWAYGRAMDKHRANELINEGKRRAVLVAGQIGLRGQQPSLAEFTDSTFAGGSFKGVTTENLSGQFGLQVEGVRKRVCENVLSSIGENTPLRRLATDSVPALANCADDNAFLMIYNNDLSGASGDAKYCESDSDCTVCGTCNNHTCSNECAVETKTCTTNDQCADAGVCAGCNTETGTCQYMCEAVEYLESTGTQYIDTGYVPVDSTEIIARMRASTSDNGHVFYGGGGTYHMSELSCYLWSSVIQLHRYDRGGGPEEATRFYPNIWFTHINSKTLREVTFEGKNPTRWTNTINASYNQNTLHLFSHNRGAPTPTISGTAIATFKISDNSDLKRDFIPVLAPTKAEGATGQVPAMFDKVEGRIYYNAGTGSFKTNLDN